MTRLPIEVKEKAVKLRRKGYSLKEISQKLNIAKSTASLWLNSIELGQKAQERLAKRGILGQYKTILIRKRKRKLLFSALEKKLLFELKDLKSNVVRKNELYKLICGVMFWCEGGKGLSSGVKFINSDPNMIKTFLGLLRKSYPIDENKFRAIVHLHEYHSEKEQIAFWSKITGIPLKQFNKSYIKPHTGKRIKDNYPGCISISYYDSMVAKELFVYSRVLTKYLGV